MSNSTNSIIYIKLVNEGTLVYRPVEAEMLKDFMFKINRTENYDPEDEQWEFLPDQTVRCVEQIVNDKNILVAVERLF